MLECESRQVLQRTVDLDVRVEIEDAAAVIGKQVLQKTRFDRSRKLRNIVDRRQSADFCSSQSDVAQSNALELFAARIKLPGLVVDEQKDEPTLGMMLKERTRQDPNVSNVVTCRNGADSYHQSLTAICQHAWEFLITIGRIPADVRVKLAL